MKIKKKISGTKSAKKTSARYWREVPLSQPKRSDDVWGLRSTRVIFPFCEDERI